MPLLALFQSAAPVVSPLTDYLLNHLHILGWPALVWLMAKVCFRIGRFLTLLETRILSHESKVIKLADEEMPAVQDGLAEINETLLDHLPRLVAARTVRH